VAEEVEMIAGIDYAKIKRYLEEALREELAPVREETSKVLDAVSIVAGGAEEFTVQSVSKHSALIVTVRALYDAAATAGVRVRWLYSADNTNFDSAEDAEDAGNYEDLTFAAGTTRQRTVLIPLFQPYVKVQIVNLDDAHTVIVSCWKTLMR